MPNRTSPHNSATTARAETAGVDEALRTLRSFDRSLPMSLLKAREAVLRTFIPHLRAHGLSAQQWRVLRALAESDGLDISELADACSLLRPSVSRILQNLEGRGFISRRPCTRDSRRSLLFITAAGRGLIAELAPESEERYDYIEARFGRENLSRLYELLDELVRALDGPSPFEDEAHGGLSEGGGDTAPGARKKK